MHQGQLQRGFEVRGTISEAGEVIAIAGQGQKNKQVVFSPRARLILSSLEKGRLLTRINHEATVVTAPMSINFSANSWILVHLLPIAEDFRNGKASCLQRIGRTIAGACPQNGFRSSNAVSSNSVPCCGYP
jgi:hypothetical protein